MMQWRYEPDASFAIGVDIGGTKINAGIICEKGEILHMCSLPTSAGQVHVTDRIHQAIELLMDEAGKLNSNWLRVRGIGVGTAGQVDWAEGSIRFANELIRGYTGIPLRQQLEDRYELPVRVDNDVNVLALTEKTLGSGRGIRHFICLALGTGVGGTMVVDGEILHGSWGGAGELGHISVNFNGLPCVCGGIGCLEQYASGTGIANRMRKLMLERGIDLATRLEARDVIAGWQKGDDAATSIMDETFAALGAALSSLLHVFNPELIVIGGGVAEAGENFINRVREETAKRSMSSFFEGVRMEPAYRGNWSGMIGAGLQMWEYAGECSL